MLAAGSGFEKAFPDAIRNRHVGEPKQSFLQPSGSAHVITRPGFAKTMSKGATTSKIACCIIWAESITPALQQYGQLRNQAVSRNSLLPPEDEQAPIEITHFGSSIWS